MPHTPRSDEDPPPKSVSRWEDEGGAEGDGAQLTSPPPARPSAAGAVSPNEWAEMKTRVIALENLVIALLKTGSPEQRALAREMAEFILPRPGATHHRLTVHAAHRMSDLIDRAERFDSGKD
jgi:hypothetical protein